MSFDRVLGGAWSSNVRTQALQLRMSVQCRPMLCQGMLVTRKSVVRRYAEEQGSAGSAREKLRANPAYQRLKKASWKDSYKPAGETLLSCSCCRCTHFRRSLSCDPQVVAIEEGVAFAKGLKKLKPKPPLRLSRSNKFRLACRQG